MSDAAEPDARDWFRGRPADGARAPRAVGEAFGHLPKEAASGASEWFGAGGGAAGDEISESSAASTPVEADTPDRLSASPAAQMPAAPPAPLEPTVPEAAAPEAAAPEPTAREAAAPQPASDGRTRLRALTGGLADLSDALAAIGVESVALRGSRAAAPQQAAPAADFRVRCPDCGPQYVAIADVRFVETGDGAEANRYLFTCPACGARVRRPAGPELAEILKSAGVATLALRRGPGQAL